MAVTFVITAPLPLDVVKEESGRTAKRNGTPNPVSSV
jgi:hypothetical protein